MLTSARNLSLLKQFTYVDRKVLITVFQKMIYFIGFWAKISIFWGFSSWTILEFYFSCLIFSRFDKGFQGFTFRNYFTLCKIVSCTWIKSIFFYHHSFMKKGHSKLSKNEPENMPWINPFKCVQYYVLVGLVESVFDVILCRSSTCKFWLCIWQNIMPTGLPLP